MKKYFVTAAVITFLAACGGGTGTAGNADSSANPTPAVADISANPDYQKGLELISKNDCLTCHKVAEKLIGPAYQEVADKYVGVDTAVAYLSKKVIEGGTGVWGQVAMTPHATISQADAEQMVKYVLLLKSN